MIDQLKDTAQKAADKRERKKLREEQRKERRSFLRDRVAEALHRLFGGSETVEGKPLVIDGTEIETQKDGYTSGVLEVRVLSSGDDDIGFKVSAHAKEEFELSDIHKEWFENIPDLKTALIETLGPKLDPESIQEPKEEGALEAEVSMLKQERAELEDRVKRLKSDKETLRKEHDEKVRKVQSLSDQRDNLSSRADKLKDLLTRARGAADGLPEELQEEIDDTLETGHIKLLEVTGNKIEAIKAVRSITGKALKEAKRLVDDVANNPRYIEGDETDAQQLAGSMRVKFNGTVYT